MWLSSNRMCRSVEMQKKISAFLCICISAVLLSACGFTPMYGAKNQEALNVGIIIDAPHDEMGQQLQQNLEDQLNPPGGVPAKPMYLLSASLDTAVGSIGVGRDGTVSRYNVTLISNYKLVRISDSTIVHQGQVRQVSSFNNQTNQYFSTYISQKDSIRRGIIELTELYRQRITTLLVKMKSA